MKEQTKKSNLTALAPLLLFVIFTICILTVLLTGADIYQKISQRDQNSFQRRTAVQYLTTRLRQSDAEKMVFVGDFSTGTADSAENSGNFGSGSATAGDTLFLREELNGRTFYTRIYCHDGYLCELFSEAGLETAKRFGQPILEVNALHFTIQGNLLYVEIEYADSTVETLMLHLRSGEEAAL